MKAQLKCSNCGAEISNLNMSWEKKQWLWSIPFIILVFSMAFLMEFLMKDRNDFRTDLHVSNVEKNSLNGTIEIFGIIENRGKVNWESIVIEAEFFAEDSKFLDELTSRICTNLSPGACEHFKISSNNLKIKQYYSVMILTARRKMLLKLQR